MTAPFNRITLPFNFIADYRDKSVHPLECSQVVKIMEGGHYQFYEKLEDAKQAGYSPAVCVGMKRGCNADEGS